MPRRIVLLSDGTGNSSASFWRTNVWRMFCALDLTSSDQVACYDDGVGTSSFKPLAILGGAFGIGLRRNVISLYKFACRNFRAPGDEIYAFGFSRGAFTIRVVIGLIIDQGLIPAANISESELDKRARQAYRNYHRAHFHTNWGLIVKQIRKWFGQNIAPQTAPPAGHNIPVIRFLGLWDTVAAYGLPIDEMTRGVSQWLWPLEIPSHSLHASVQRACHALSLDDERTTFHPVLWDESTQVPQAATPRFTSGERISQIWFAGVHANVGGGYPDDSLAHIPLYWIIQEAKVCGLTFKIDDPDAIAEIKQAQDKDGRLYDSRSGAGSYYRYGPRRLSRLCNELFSRTLEDSVSISRPKIDESVLRRIQNNAHVYAPIGIPHDYELVVTVPRPNTSDADFRIDPLPAAPAPGAYELSGDAQARVVAERKAVWPLVYIRALLYLLTLLATAAFVIFPLTGRSNPLYERENELKWVSDLIRTVANFLPGWASSWFVAYASYPKTFLALAVVLVVLLAASSKVAASIADQMTALWKASLAHTLAAPVVAPTNELTVKERVLQALRSGWKDYLGPALSAIAIVYLGITLLNRSTFTALDEAGFVCTQSADSKDLKDIPLEGVLFSFDISSPCFATGYKVGRLDRYLVWTMPERAELDEENKAYQAAHKLTNDRKEVGTCTTPADGTLASAGVTADGRGYSTFRNDNGPSLGIRAILLNALLLPLKRHYGAPWLQPIARYGSIGNELDFLEPDPDPSVTKISENVVPKVPGELFLYVNDAVVGLPGVQPFYWDNKGCATFFVRPPSK
jgi:uncharacterized protein (DUF2235 family)